MSKADEIRAKAERLARQQATGGATVHPLPTPDPEPEVPAEPAKPRRTRSTSTKSAPAKADTPVAVRGTPIRSTVDLAPARHRDLKKWCDHTAEHLGRARVTTQDVLRTLVARLIEDDTLARKIRDDLQKGVQ